MQGHAQLRLSHARQQPERDGEEPLHIADAAAVGASTLHAQGERVAGPVLTGDGHDVGVAGEDEPAASGAVRGGDGDEEVGAGAVLVVGAHAAVAVAAEFGFEKLDEFQVGATGDGGDRDKLFEPGEGRRLSGLCGHEEPFCCAFVPGVATFRVRRGAVFVAWSPPNTAP